MLNRQLIAGDLVRVLKEWYWVEEDDGLSAIPSLKTRYNKRTPSGRNSALNAGYLWPPYMPMVITPAFEMRSVIPADKSLLVIEASDLTIRFMLEEKTYRVTAACMEHILSDFELLSSAEGDHI